MTREALLAEALALPWDERVELLRELAESLDPPASRSESEWVDEVRRRIEEVQQGVAKTIPADEVFANIRERLRSVRG